MTTPQSVPAEDVPAGFVWVSHPHADIGDALVPESAVPTLRGSGWEIRPEPEPEPADEAPGPPPGNASADTWRDYARANQVADADQYSRDQLRDHFLNGKPLGDADEDQNDEEQS